MKNVERVASEILKICNFDLRSLEQEYNKIKKKLGNKNVGTLSLKELRTILAFEYLKDGAEIDFAQEILSSEQTKPELLKELARFDY
ncbi:MAG: hypothetical protein PHF86_06750 [Candidatus Nanoarchaeia archaeon]|jgi:vacuolar-type H+-ATPase subunit I/STV1|nr:hypothetical protein [Candidatus Nanoarchaeia archaeon]